MAEAVRFHFLVDGENFTMAGQASVAVKKNLRQLGVSPETIRRVSIAMYEGEINMDKTQHSPAKPSRPRATQYRACAWYRHNFRYTRR